MIAMYALTRTPLGRMCNAVRDNPERIQFVGYDPHIVRYLAFCFSGFFAGIAGALAAINFEIANSAYLGAVQSGTVLFATYIGGVGFFIGPIVGAIFVTLLSLSLSDLTSVWQLYFGIFFIAVVMFAPGGITGLLMMHWPLFKAGTLGRILPSYLIALVPTLAMVAGAVLAIETIVHHTVNSDEDPNIKAFGIQFNASNPITWLLAAVLVIVGFFLARKTWTLIGQRTRVRPGEQAVVADDQLEGYGDGLAEDMLKAMPDALRLTKRSLDAGLEMSVEAAMEIEERAQMLMIARRR